MVPVKYLNEILSGGQIDLMIVSESDPSVIHIVSKKPYHLCYYTFVVIQKSINQHGQESPRLATVSSYYWRPFPKQVSGTYIHEIFEIFLI